MGPSALPIWHIPVFVPLSASMSDALILPFTFSSECFHLIGAYRLWLSDSEYKREHLRELHIKKPSRFSLLVFQTNFLFFSFLKPHNLDGALLMITEVPLAIAWDPGFPTRGPWRYSRGAIEKISYIKSWIFITFLTNDPVRIIECRNGSWYSEWKLAIIFSWVMESLGL